MWEQSPATEGAALQLQAKEKHIGRLQLKLQRQQTAIEEIEALKVCLGWDPHHVAPSPACCPRARLVSSPDSHVFALEPSSCLSTDSVVPFQGVYCRAGEE